LERFAKIYLKEPPPPPPIPFRSKVRERCGIGDVIEGARPRVLGGLYPLLSS